MLSQCFQVLCICPTVAPTTGAITAPPTTAAPSTIAPKAKAAPPLLLAPPTSVELRLGAIEDKMCVLEAKLDQLLVLVQERFCC